MLVEGAVGEVGGEQFGHLAGQGDLAGAAPSPQSGQDRQRTVPFGLLAYTVTLTWYALTGHRPTDTEEHRLRARWYTTKGGESQKCETRGCKPAKNVPAPDLGRFGCRPRSWLVISGG